MQTNPDLLNPASSTQVAVQPLAAITPPQGNTQVAEERYYYSTMQTSCMHRKDGKKLPFLNHIFKTSFKEDIEYLDYEIAQGNSYIRNANQQEIEHAKLMADPMGTVREAVKKDVIENFTVDQLEKLLEERRKAVQAGDDAAKIAGTEEFNRHAGDVIRAQGVQHAAHTGANTKSLAALLVKNSK